MPTAPKTYRPRGGSTGRRERDRAYDARRGSSAARGYDRRWRKARLAHLAEHPLCVECLTLGITEPATVVDHIRDHKGDPVLFWDPVNWQSLCEPHHNAKTARPGEGGG